MSAATLATEIPHSEAVDDQPRASAFAHRYTLQFDADAKAYATIWAQNLALIILTLGLYLPWARARRLRFVAQHTLLDGSRWDFHGDPRRMARPTLIFGSFLLLYAVASYLDPLAGFVAALAFALLWPPVWRSATVFRLYQTSWRGLRFRLMASDAQAYEHMGLALILLVFPLAWLNVDKSVFELQSVATWLALLALLTWGALYPGVQWKSRQLLHGLRREDGRGGVRFGTARFVLRLQPKTVFMKYVPLYAAFAGSVVAFVMLTQMAGLKLFDHIGSGSLVDVSYFAVRREFWLLLTPFLILGYVLLRSLALSIAMPMYLRRTLCDTHALGLRFEVNLPLNSVLERQALNTLFILLTLGLYWPFAKMHMTRLQLQSISILSSVPLADFVEHRSPHHPEEPELAADMATVDMGW